jgi:hypothetical protein
LEKLAVETLALQSLLGKGGNPFQQRVDLAQCGLGEYRGGLETFAAHTLYDNGFFALQEHLPRASPPSLHKMKSSGRMS